MKKFLTLALVLFCSIGMNADELYLVGDGTPIGWEGDGNSRQPCRMTEASEGVYVWTGMLRHGSEGFKICNSFGGWDGYHPSSANFEIADTGSDNYSTDNSKDTKWNPANTDWQWYTITLDKNAGTLSWAPASPTLLEPVDGVYYVGTAEQLNTLALMSRNNVNGDSYNVKLTADIDYTAYTQSYDAVLGPTEALPFRGEFDGQGHTVTVDLTVYSTRVGLFGIVQGKIHDLKIDGKLTATTRNQIGGFCGLLKGNDNKIYNCISAVEIVDAQSGDGTIGGFCAVTYDATALENCAFYGKISAPNREGSGGLVGWCNSGSDTSIKNCLIVAETNWKSGSNNTDFGRNNPSVTNSYRVDATDPSLANGQMTYKLNNYVSGGENWFQTLDADAMPTPFSTSQKLYANGTFLCDGVTSKRGDIVLSNTDASVVDPHVFGEDGVCTGCHAVGEEATETDGIYQLNNAGNLLWWAQFVNAGNPTSQAALNADIDLSGAKYTPAGTSESRFEGNFFGKHHSVTLALDNPELNYQGLFGVITDGAWIERVTTKGFVKGNNFVGGIAGGTNGGSSNVKKANIWYCGNEATITAEGANGAGIIGVNMSGNASIIITNCYNTADITSGREAGAISGWLGGGWSSVRNTYNTGTVKNGSNTSKAFGRNNGCFFTNCYFSAASGTDNSTEDTGNGKPTSVSDAAVLGGELAYKLGEDFHQLLGTDAYPVLDAAKPNVYKLDVTAAGYATLVPTVNVTTLPAGVTAYVAQNLGTFLHLEAVSELPADNAFIVKAAAGTYYYNNTDEDLTLAADNDLTFSDTETTADGSQYVLAQKDGQVGFYRATSGTIAARKAFVASSSGVKAFFFGEDETTGVQDALQANNAEGAIYNLSGQRIDKVQKGINIVGGKKILK